MLWGSGYPLTFSSQESVFPIGTTHWTEEYLAAHSPLLRKGIWMLPHFTCGWPTTLYEIYHLPGLLSFWLTVQMLTMICRCLNLPRRIRCIFSPFLKNATHLVQPAGVGLFSSMKQTWHETVRRFSQKHCNMHITKKNFCSVFKSTWDEIIRLSTL